MACEQSSFLEAFAHPQLGANAKLEKIAALIDWAPLAREARSLLKPGPGRPPHDPLLMLKALWLAALYDLSDPGLEEALGDRLSFRRFCGLALDAATPDETAFCRFRARAAETGLMQRAFEEIARQLEANGFVLKKGTLMDATLIAAAHRPPGRGAGGRAAAGATHPKEPGASWTKKNGRSHFGYKLHIGVDAGSGLIRRIETTGAKTYESEVADRLISWDERAVYGDKAYPQDARRSKLKSAGIKDRISWRRRRNQPRLPRWREQWNQLLARRRAPVEAPFSAMKRLYGMARARCHSLSRNAVRFAAVAIVYNLRRATLIAA